MTFIEDHQYLQQWICKIKFMINKMKNIVAYNGGRVFFTIGNTTKQTEGLRPYTTPIRKISNGVVCGVVVFTQTQGLLAASIADALVDSILIDAEKKLPLLTELDAKPFNDAGIPIPEIGDLQTQDLNHEKWNLSAACSAVVKRADCFEYKSNDMTVEGLWYYLASGLRGLNGRKIAIIGGGNIGFKLSIKLVESGCDVQFVRRDASKGKALASAVNLIKPPATMATVQFNSDPVNASKDCDAIIGCTDGKSAITLDMVRAMKSDGFLVDVGKGSIVPDGVKLAHEIGLNVLRCDVTAAIDGMIATVENNRLSSVKVGRKELVGGIMLVSGGYLGAEGNIVVDDYRNPRQIFGICDGHGDLKQILSLTDKESLSKVRLQFGIESI